MSISRKRGKQQSPENGHTIWRNVSSSIPVPPSFPHCLSIFKSNGYCLFLNLMVTSIFFLTSWTSRKEADEQVQWAQGKVYKVHLEFFFSTRYFASVLKFFMFITHRRQESLMPSSRGGVGRMLPKIIGTCHTDGMEMMHNIIFSWWLRRNDDFKMVFSWWLDTGQSVSSVTLLP